jgi:penicillin-insensitive murein endopeptidase
MADLPLASRLVRRLTWTLLMVLAYGGMAAAQDLGTMDPKPLPPLEHPNDPKTPAKELFGRKTAPASMQARSIGYYTHGCLAGGVALPINGPTWQVMRLSRNRNWGHPNLIKTLEDIARKAPSIGWPGLLVGDMAQPRGGPMLNGHWSHQVGLDADVWLTPMPDHKLSRKEREEISATNVVNDQFTDVRPDVWSKKYIALYKLVAQEPGVERVLANPAIKKALCRDVKGDRSWLHKIRPVLGHNYHFHVRINCPEGSTNCKSQPPPPNDEGCGKDLESWFKPKPRDLTVVFGGRKPIPMSALPAECKKILAAPSTPSTQPAWAQMPASAEPGSGEPGSAQAPARAPAPASPPAQHEPIPD